MKKFILPILILLSVSVHAQTVTIRHGGTGKTTRQGAIDTLSNVSQATEGMALTDSSGHAIWSTAGAISTPVSIANGGTNSSTALSGSSIMVSDATHIVQGAAGTTTTVLHGNASGAPTYGSVTSSDIGDTVKVAVGGTGLKTITSHGIMYGNGAANVGVTAAGTDAQILQGNTGLAPTWTTLNALLIVLSDTTGNTGKKLTVKAGGGFDWE